MPFSVILLTPCSAPHSQLFTSPLLLLDLFLITGVGTSTRAFMLFSNAMMVLCWLSGAFITSASRWGFWVNDPPYEVCLSPDGLTKVSTSQVFGLLFSLGVLIPMVGVLPTAAARCSAPPPDICLQAFGTADLDIAWWVAPCDDPGVDVTILVCVARKGRSARRLYGRLMCVTLMVGVVYPWAWVLIDGSHGERCLRLIPRAKPVASDC